MDDVKLPLKKGSLTEVSDQVILFYVCKMCLKMLRLLFITFLMFNHIVSVFFLSLCCIFEFIVLIRHKF